MNTHMMELITPVRVKLPDTRLFDASTVLFDLASMDDSNPDYIKITSCFLIDSKNPQQAIEVAYKYEIRFYKYAIGSISVLPPFPVAPVSPQPMLEGGQPTADDVKYIYNGGATYYKPGTI